MSLSSNVASLATRVATEFKSLRLALTGNASGSLSGLATTNKDHLVAAINEVNTKAESAAGGGATIDDDNVSSGTVYSSAKVVDLVDDLQDDIDAKPSIADGSSSSSSNTWSVSKIVSELANVDVDLTDLIDDEDASTSTVYSSSQTEAFVASELADLVNSAPSTLDTLGEIATAIENNQDAIDALSAIGDGAVRFDTDQSSTITSGQKTAARANIGAASASDLTALTTAVGDTEPDPSFVDTFDAGLE